MQLRRIRGEDGAIAILVAAFAIVMFGFAAIIVDLGDARMLSSDAGNAADAAALAAANDIADRGGGSGSDAGVAAVVKSSVAANWVSTNWGGCVAGPRPPGWSQAPGGGTDCILVHTGSSGPDRVRVTVPTKKSLSAFGGVFGFSGVDVSSTAQAQVRRPPVPDCGLCVLGALDTSGPVAVRGGDSFAGGTGRVRSGGSVTVDPPGVLTFTTRPNPATGPYSPAPSRGAPNNPLVGAALPAASGPPTPGTVTCGSGGGAVPSLGPGVYSRIDVTGACSATGTITVTNRLRVRNGGQLTGNSATIYLVCGTPTAPAACSGSGAQLQLANGGRVDFSGATLSGFSLVADPGNTRAVTISSRVSLSESVYLRSASVVTVTGSGSLAVSRRTVVRNLTVQSGGSVSAFSSGGSLVDGPLDVRLSRVAP